MLNKQKKEAEEERQEAERYRKEEEDASKRLTENMSYGGSSSSAIAQSVGFYRTQRITAEGRAEHKEKDAQGYAQTAAWHERRADEEKANKDRGAVNQSDNNNAATPPQTEVF